MSDNRKHVKVAIPERYVPAFDRAKAEAETVAMMKMTDTQYASRLVQWALERHGQKE